MFRKIALAATAALALTVAAVAPASARHFGHHGGGFRHFGGHFGHHHHGFFGHRHRHFGFGHYGYAGGGCWRTVWTDFGPRRTFVCGDVF